MATMHVTLMVKFGINFGFIDEFLLSLPHPHIILIIGSRQHDTQHQYSQARAPPPGHEVVMLSGQLTHKCIPFTDLLRRYIAKSSLNHMSVQSLNLFGSRVFEERGYTDRGARMLSRRTEVGALSLQSKRPRLDSSTPR